MKVFYGKNLVEKNEYLVNNKNLICRKKDLLVLSEREYSEFSLKNQNKLIIWGKIYATIQSDGTYLPFNGTSCKDSILQKIFTNSHFEDIIPKIEGDFVGCLINKDYNVTIFSDSFNRKDVFYSLSKNELAASTSLLAVLPGGKKTYDQAALANYFMVYGAYAPKKHTFYKGVKRLGVGERLVVADNMIRIEKIPFHPCKVAEYGAHELEEYMNLLEDAIKIRGSGHRNWLYLSSGWDSSTLLTLLVKLYGTSSVNAVIGKMFYSERSGNANRYEIERAAKIAEYFSVDLEIVPLDYTKKNSINYWEKIRPFLKENHIYAGNSCNFYLLSNYISKKASAEDVIFCGEISDGAHNLGFSQFLTILEHPVLAFREYSDKMASYLFGPTFFKRIVSGDYAEDAVYKFLRYRLSGHMFDDEKELTEYERKMKVFVSFFLRNQRIPFYGLKNLQFLTENGGQMYESEMVTTYLKECVDTIKPEMVYSWLLHLYNSFHWQGSTVKTMHETAQYHHLHLTMPFWDLRLQYFLSRMPENWGRGLELRPTKYPMKWMLQNKTNYPMHLQVGPHSYHYDVSPGFSLSKEIVYKSSLCPHFQTALAGYPFEKILDKHFFNIGYFRKLTDEYLAGVEVSGQKLTDLFNLIFLCWIGCY